MDETVIKLVIMLCVALIAVLTAIALEFKTKQVRPVNTIGKSALALVLAGLLVSII